MKKKIVIPWAKPDINKEELNEIKDSFKSNWLTQGPKVKLFEKKMSNFCNARYAIAVSNGTLALDIALKTIGIKSGDEVILPAMTYISTASMISYQNAIPVFVDIKEKNFNIDPDKIEKAITKKTKAIMFIDYGGNPSDINKILKIGKKYGLKIIQDGAQSLGARYNGKPVGANAEISTMSFHMAKILSCIEGGMIFTNSKKYRDEILMRRSHGEEKPGDYIHHILGTNARLTDLQAAIGLSQFKKLKFFLRQRKKVAKIYNNLFSDSRKILLPEVNKNSSNAYFFYPILIDNRDRIAKKLKEKYGIDTRIAYKMPIYKQNLYRKKIAKFKKSKCIVAENVTKKILNLPIYPTLKLNQILYIAKSIKNELKS